MTHYKRTKRKEILKLDKLSNDLWISHNHELNKEKIRSIINIAETLLKLEEEYLSYDEVFSHKITEEALVEYLKTHGD